MTPVSIQDLRSFGVSVTGARRSSQRLARALAFRVRCRRGLGGQRPCTVHHSSPAMDFLQSRTIYRCTLRARLRMSEQLSFATMRHGAFRANPPPGELFDNEAFWLALENGAIGGVTLNAVLDEPSAVYAVSRTGMRVLVTPHMAFPSGGCS